MRVVFSELNPEAPPFSCDHSAEGTDAEGSDPGAKRSGRYSVNKLEFDTLEGEPHDVASFLRFLRLHKYIDSLNQQRITLVQLLSMSEDDLIEIGFTAHGARKRLHTGIMRYHEYLARTWFNTSENDSDTGSSAPSSPDLASPRDGWLALPGGLRNFDFQSLSMPDLLRRPSNTTIPSGRASVTSPIVHRRLSAFVDLGLSEQVECEMSRQYYSRANVVEQPEDDEGYTQEFGNILRFMETAEE